MRKFGLTLVMLLCASTVAGQHYVGVKGGFGGATGRFYPMYYPVSGGDQTFEHQTEWGKKTAGIMWKYYGTQQVLGGVGAELEFQQRGYTIATSGINTPERNYTVRRRTLNSITMPLVWQPHLYFAKRRVRVFLSAGVTLSYNLDGGGKYIEQTWRGGELTGTTTVPYTMHTARDVRWNYGWLGGFGFGVLVGRMEVFAEGRYYYGMSDILRTKTKYIFNEMGSIRSELDNVSITMGVYFRLGKGGIKEAPLRKPRRAAPGESDFRNVKLPF